MIFIQARIDFDQQLDDMLGGAFEEKQHDEAIDVDALVNPSSTASSHAPSRAASPPRQEKEKMKMYDSDDDDFGSSSLQLLSASSSPPSVLSNSISSSSPSVQGATSTNSSTEISVSAPSFSVSQFEAAAYTPSFKLHHVFNVGSDHVLLFLWRPVGWRVDVSVKGRNVQALYFLPPFPLREVIETVIEAKKKDSLISLPVEAPEWSKEVKKEMVLKEIDEGETMVYNVKLEKDVVGVQEFVRGGEGSNFVFFQLRVDKK